MTGTRFAPYNIALTETSENAVYANFGESPEGELRRIPIPRTPVNKGKGRVFAIEYVSRDSVCYERVASG